MNTLQQRLQIIKNSVLQINADQYNQMSYNDKLTLIESIIIPDVIVYGNRMIDNILVKVANEYHKTNSIDDETFEVLLEILDLAEKYAANWSFS